ncbi:MAG: hypothetical protein ACXACU_13625 [Candidatus Hodarchaeales archaeon]
MVILANSVCVCVIRDKGLAQSSSPPSPLSALPAIKTSSSSSLPE